VCTSGSPTPTAGVRDEAPAELEAIRTPRWLHAARGDARPQHPGLRAARPGGHAALRHAGPLQRAPQLDELQRRNWTTVTDTGGAWLTQTRNNLVTDDTGNRIEQAYTLNWRITDDVVGVTRLVDVRVTWTEEGGDDRAYSLSSIRYNRENL
jgi:hypothetical protein